MLFYILFFFSFPFFSFFFFSVFFGPGPEGLFVFTLILSFKCCINYCACQVNTDSQSAGIAKPPQTTNPASLRRPPTTISQTRTNQPQKKKKKRKSQQKRNPFSWATVRAHCKTSSRVANTYNATLTY